MRIASEWAAERLLGIEVEIPGSAAGELRRTLELRFGKACTLREWRVIGGPVEEIRTEIIWHTDTDPAVIVLSLDPDGTESVTTLSSAAWEVSGVPRTSASERCPSP